MCGKIRRKKTSYCSWGNKWTWCGTQSKKKKKKKTYYNSQCEKSVATQHCQMGGKYYSIASSMHYTRYKREGCFEIPAGEEKLSTKLQTRHLARNRPLRHGHRPRNQHTFYCLVLTYLLTPWSRVLLEKLTSKLCS